MLRMLAKCPVKDIHQGRVTIEVNLGRDTRRVMFEPRLVGQSRRSVGGAETQILRGITPMRLR